MPRAPGQAGPGFGIMRAMVIDALWRPAPPVLPAAVQACVVEPGSLTERLQASGRVFSVSVLRQGMSALQADEAWALAQTAGAPAYAREVALLLDGKPVVYARSVSRADCQTWRPILERGNRSLGLTLFGGLPQLRREALQYRLLAAPHPLAAAAGEVCPAAAYPARRCRFLLEQAPLLLSELFLPDLESLL